MTPLAAAIGGILTAGSTAVLAQEADSESNLVEEIVVTATRRETSVLDVPYNISAIAGQTLVDAQIFENADLMRQIAGAGVVDRGQRNQGVINSIMIRGLNIDGAALGDYALNTVPTVSTYVNETPIYANFILKDIQRVEVLRGPQGTLYGSGSLGGTVRYIMNKPNPDAIDGQAFAWVSQTEGSQGTNYGGDFMFNLPLSDATAFRISAGTLQGAGVVDAVNVYELDNNGVPLAPNGILDPEASFRRVEDADDADIRYARASFYAEPNEKFNFLLSYQMQEDDIGGRRQRTNGTNGSGVQYGKYEIGSIQLEPSSRDVDLLSLEVEMDLGFATLTSSTSSYDHNGDSVSENTGFYAQNGWLANFYYNYPRPMASARRTYSDESFVQELRLVSQGERTVDWVIGGFYRDQDLNSTQTSLLVGYERWADLFFGNPNLIVQDQDFGYERDENFTDLAFYGEATWHTSDTFHLTFGLRWFENDFKNNTYMQVGVWDPSIFNFEDTAFFKGNEKDTLFKLNAAWNVSDQQTVYATISEGYRRGGSNAVPLVGFFAEDPGWQQYGPDTVINYEIGIKGTTDRLNYSVAAFYVDWDNVQLNTATSNWGFFAAANGDSARTAGLELELDGNISDNVSYNIGYAYVDGKITGDAMAPTTPSFVLAEDGAPLIGTAKNTLNAALQFTMNISNGYDWTTRINGYYQSKTYNAFGDGARAPGTFTAELDGFALVDLVTWISADAWRASLYVRNLTNETGSTGLFSELYMGTDPAQNYVGNGSKQFLTLPRTIGFALTYDF
ncbi:MAG: TonB-dependent receptor [Gammaproteobacteria bacterium]|nr:TonB-dependent receptor [Gammaproteobacteria bacterium]